MKATQLNGRSAALNKLARNFCCLLLGALLTGTVSAGPTTHYRMDNLLKLPGFGDSFTFSVNDLNNDGIGSSDEIRNFSGLACYGGNCPFSTWTTQREVDRDFTFDGSGETFFDLDIYYAYPSTIPMPTLRWVWQQFIKQDHLRCDSSFQCLSGPSGKAV